MKWWKWWRGNRRRRCATAEPTSGLARCGPRHELRPRALHGYTTNEDA